MAIDHPITEQFIEKLFTRINKNGPIPSARPDLGPCWIWTGTCDKDGYGKYCIPGRRHRSGRAHRLVYQLFVHPIDSITLFCCHHCDNPPCCNPKHLWLGTITENNADRMAKGRHTTKSRGLPKIDRQGEKHWNAKLSPDNVIAIRASSETQSALAAKYGVSIPTIKDIQIRRRWKHL